MGGWISRLFHDKPRCIELKEHKLKIERKIGEGGFAEVFIVSDVHTGQKFALKKFNALDDEQRVVYANTEIQVLKNFTGKSPHIIELVDTDDFQFALLPLYPLGALQSIIDKKRSGTDPYIPIPGQFTKVEILQISLDICEALSIFHSNEPPLAHRDISPGNVLLKETEGKKRAVIMDFGSTAKARVSTESYSDCLKLQEICESTCSVLYRAPELHEVVTHSIIDERSDVWSLGCVIYFMMYGISPFEYALKEGGSVKLAAMGANPTFHEMGYEEELVQLIKSILITDVEKRPTIFDVKSKIEEIIMFAQMDQ